MKRITLHLVFLTTVLMLAEVSAAQVATGTMPFNSYGGGPFDVVNLGNLNVHFAVPVFHKAGRGLPFNYDLSYDSSVWTPVVVNSVLTWQPAQNWGWTIPWTGTTGYVTYQVIGGNCGGPPPTGGWQSYVNWQYVDRSGAVHGFPGSWYFSGGSCGTNSNSSFTSPASDNSGLTLFAGSCSGGGICVQEANGKRYYPPVNPTNTTQVQTTQGDDNGNQITLNPTNGQITDTLGQVALTIAGTNPMTFAYTPPSGTPVNYGMTYGIFNVKTHFGCSVADTTINNVSLVTSISLPDGTSYSFTYETTQGFSTYKTGRLASVTLPTGGTITYSYPLTNSGTTNGINCTDGAAPVINATTPSLTRAVSPGGTWTYARSAGQGTNGLITTTVDPNSNQTVINFQKDSATTNNTNNFYETYRKVYQGSSTLIGQTFNCWNGLFGSPCLNAPVVSSPISLLDSYVQRADGNTNVVQTNYDANGQVTARRDYDWSQILTRDTEIAYASLGGIVDHPASVVVKDASGVVKASTTYTYDEGTVTSTTGTPNHVAVTTSRGNLTTSATQVSGSTTLYRRFTYYDTGTPNTATDAGTTTSGGPNVSTYTYGASSCGNSFVTSISEPLTLSRSMTWDCTGGVMTSLTDENTKTATTFYTGTGADAFFWRPYQAQDQMTPANTTTFTYPSATAIESSMLFNSNNSVVDNRTKFDGFGRPIVGQIKQGPTASNYDSVETDYDIAGRISKSTRPYSATAGTLCSGGCPGTIMAYDAAGRSTTTTDGVGTLTTSYPNMNSLPGYSNSDVLQTVGPPPTGENTKRKQLEYDGLGRLTSVCEVSSATGSGACGQNNPQTGFWTKYTYDLLNNMTVVTQNAQAASGSQQTRTYTFDMIGRLTSELNPETGTTAITYTYDSWNVSCGTYTSAGDLVEKKDAMGNVTCLKYDALHRLTDVTYPSGSYAAATAPKHYVYDSATVNGTVMSNAKGRLAEAYTGTSGSKITDLGFSRSARGEVTDVWESTPNSGGYYHPTAAYWANGALKNVWISLLPSISYGADGEGRTSTVSATSGQNPVTATSYNVARQVTGVTFGSADSDAYQYDANTGRMTQYQFNMGTGPQTDTGALTWNANGTLKQLQITDQINTANSQTCTFGHDDLVRITSANCGAWAQTFGVDPFGNLTKSGSAQFLPTYTSSPPTNRYASIPGGSVTYDPNGNLTNDVTHAYTWDADGNMLSTDGSTVTMIYDALDRMIEQTRGAAHTQIVYAPYGMKLALMNGQTFVNAFVKLPGGARAVYSSAGLAYYRHSDHLGSSRLSTTTGRAKYYDVAYAPYGEEYNGSGTQDLAFTDQNQDTVKNGWSTNLYDFMFREYRTGHGRWTSPDPAGLGAANPENPQSWNRYAYVLNSPTSLIDPWGLREDCITKTTNYYVDAVYSGSEKVDVCYYIPDDVFGQVGGGQNTSQTGGGQSGGGNSGNTNNNANNNNQPQPPTPQCQQAQAKVADLKKQLSSPESKQEAKVYLKEMGVGTAIGCGIGAVPEIGTPFMVGGCVVGGIGGLELANAVYAVSHLSLIATALSLDAQLAVAEVKAVVACQ